MRQSIIAGMFVMLACVLAGCADTETPNVSSGKALRPFGAEAPSVPQPANSIYFFKDRDFRGDVARVENVSSQPMGQALKMGENWDEMTSVRWRLPEGVVVVLYVDAEGKGNQMALWGDGEIPSVSPWNFNDKLSRWAWFPVDGTQVTGVSERPLFSQPTGNLPDGTLEFYQDRDFKGKLETVTLDRQAMGVRHPMDVQGDKLSSLRWNLPPGKVVVLYEDAGGYGRHIPIWGKGQFDSVNKFDFDNKASRWAWYDLSRR